MADQYTEQNADYTGPAPNAPQDKKAHNRSHINDSDWYTGPAPNAPQDSNAMNDGSSSKAKTETDDDQDISITTDQSTTGSTGYPGQPTRRGKPDTDPKQPNQNM